MSTQTPNRKVYDDDGLPEPLTGNDTPDSNAPTGDPADQIRDLNNSFYGADGESRYSNINALKNQSKLDSSGYDQNDPSSKTKTPSRSEIGEQEEDAATNSGAQTQVPEAEAASFVKPGTFEGKKGKAKNRFIARFKKRAKRNTAALLITGLLAGGGIIGFEVLQGPLQLMHLSQILQRPFSSQEQDTETRTKGLLRFARTGEIGQTRISYFGNRSVEKTNAKLKDMGVTVTERSGGGRPIAYRIDAKQFAPGESADSAMKKFLKNNPKIPADHLSIKGSNVEIRNPDGGPISDSVTKAVDKGFVGKIFEGRKLGKPLTAIKARPVTRYNGAFPKWHPWEKAKVRSLEKADAAVKARQEKKAERSEKAKTRVGKFKDKIKPGTGGAGVIAGVSVAQIGICLAKDVAKATPLLSHENVVQPAENEAVELISFGEQERSNRDFNVVQPGSESKGLRDKNGFSVWDSKELNALANAGEGHGKQMPDDIKQSFSSTSPEQVVNDALDAVGGSFICSTAGQIAGGVIGAAALIAAVPTGGTSAAAFGAVTAAWAAGTVAAVTAITTLVPKLLADKPPAAELLESAPFRGSFAAIGSVELGNNFYRKAGGAELSANATSEVNQRVMIEERQELQSKSFMARMFDVNDYRSLASRTIDKANPNPTENVSNLASSIMNIGGVTSKLFSTFTPKVGAAKAYDFGFPKYGFSDEDLNNPLMEDPYDNAEKAASLLSSNGKYIERARKCFGVEIQEGNTGWEVNVIKNPDGDPEKEVIPSTDDYIKAKCAEGSNDWLRVRLFIFDSRNMEAYSCYEGEKDACAGVEDDGSAGGGGNPTAAASEVSSSEKVDFSKIGTNSDQVACAAGSDDLGVVTTKYTGVFKKESGPLKIRLCQIPTIPGQGNDKTGAVTSGGAVVDARLSGVWIAIAKKAKAGGVSLTSSSSFRLADSCGGTGDGGSCARPGQSFHQTGLAIDFGEMGGFTATGSTTSCSGRMTFNSKEYKWMRANSEPFGIKQYSAESWHWDPMQVDNRCGTKDGP